MPRRRTVDEIGDLAQRLYRERLAPRAIELEEPAAPRRHLTMPRSRRVRSSERGDMGRTPSGQIGQKIYAWPVLGSTQVAGMHAKYTVLLWSTGEISCDCTGWIMYHHTKGELACKHVKQRDDERRRIFEMWQRGETLPPQEQPDDPGVRVEGRRAEAAPERPRRQHSGESTIKRGRIIDLED